VRRSRESASGHQGSPIPTQGRVGERLVRARFSWGAGHRRREPASQAPETSAFLTISPDPQTSTYWG
jgi:hypothetical protein